MSRVVRSPQWIATQFKNQAEPPTFYEISEPL